MSIYSSNAQTQSGTILYSKKVDRAKYVDEQMRAMMRQRYSENQFLLSFNDSVSLFKLVPTNDMSSSFGGDGGGGERRVMVMGGGGIFGSGTGDLYRNWDQLLSYKSQELGNRTYIIEDSIHKQKWRLLDDTKDIFGHQCHKATITTTRNVPPKISFNNGAVSVDSSGPKTADVTVIAWYADDIKSSVGPDIYGGLPGAILQLNIDNNQTIYTAIDISSVVNAKDLKAPARGKKVTQKEYDKIVAKAMSNMNMSLDAGKIQSVNVSGGNISIIRN
jgi:GLPGLI family protein